MTESVSVGTLGTVLLAAVAGLIAILKMRVQHRQLMEVKKADDDKQKKLIEADQDKAERAARHAKEASEAQADREEKEKLINALKSQIDRSLTMLEEQGKARDEESVRQYEIADRNTRAVEKMAEAAAAQAASLQQMTVQLASLQAGGGCRAGSMQGGRPA